ncbi:MULTISPECIES: DUF2508 family protein [Clostridium]|uniref:DUF2508 family protein n=1 Tax=Clostridium cibarium TaxID=2762247 RepID=A0ABR8PWJ2_9CLOT|nr:MULTISPECIES: DUF2508 family protein [Clostridium]MBD7912546.1 DUF2508 family protein [Clostridium cibarium]
MNKRNIIEYVKGIISNNKTDDELITEIEYALLEIETARNIFNNVEDPRLIEVAIYSEEVAMKRFDHLLSIARERGISVSNEYIVDKFLELAE